MEPFINLVLLVELPNVTYGNIRLSYDVEISYLLHLSSLLRKHWASLSSKKWTLGTIYYNPWFCYIIFIVQKIWGYTLLLHIHCRLTDCNSIQKIRLMVRLAPFKFHILINGALAANLGDGRASVWPPTLNVFFPYFYSH